MDGTGLYPRGFHPSRQNLLPNNENYARPLRRIDAGSVKYFVVDFGLSTYFPDTAADCLVYGEDGQDQDVPELHSGDPYDPYKVDIFTLGNQYKKSFLDVRLYAFFLSVIQLSLIFCEEILECGVSTSSYPSNDASEP